MKAIGYKKNGVITRPDALIEFEAEMPTIGSRDLLVEVKGISINPVDVKVRANAPAESGTKVIGYDAAGIVKEVGSGVKHFKVGDEVFYAGDLTRPGTNSEFHAVDERIVGNRPKSLGFAESAGLPLTSITAWEILFDSLKIKEGDGEGESILIVGAAGGVGSMLIQLAKRLTKLTVIATASRPESKDWVKKMGADHVVNHHESLVAQIKGLELEPCYVASLTGTSMHLQSIVELIKPRGSIAIIDDPEKINVTAGKQKSLSFCWEFMFTRSMFQTKDIEKQHELLDRISKMIDDGVLISTVNNKIGRLSAETLKDAHERQESGKVIGKNVLEGF